MILPFKNSIGSKIFAAFTAMSLIATALGGYGYYITSAAGRIVVDTYDRPLMAINFARAASLDFTQMEKEDLRGKLVPQAQQASIEAKIGQLRHDFSEDLRVAAERSLGEEERRIAAEIGGLEAQWSAARLSGAVGKADDLAAHIADRFDALTEATADHSFVARRKTVWAIAWFRYTSIAAAIFALCVSSLITWLLSRHIIRPLSTAAAIADRIAGGELQTLIPAGGSDETGALLRSMTVMQKNIRRMMEREQAQTQSAQNRLFDALESAREGMLLVDAAGAIVIGNSQLGRFFPLMAPHLAEGTDVSRALEAIRPMPIEQEADAPTPPIAVHDGAVEFIGSEGEFQLGDGRWIRFARTTTQDGGFFLFFSDFTEIKEREERYRQAQLAAEAASQAKSAFLANISHELRTPLNAVIGFSEMISEQLLGPIGVPEYVEYSTDILKSGRHLLEIINNVLDIAKSEAGKLHLNIEPVDLRAVFDDSAIMLRDRCAAAQLRFTMDCPDAPLIISGDAAKLRQIVLNLLSNAMKFTEPGGSLSLVATPDGASQVRMEVVDTGIGMAPENIPIALAPFGQVDSRLARRYEGTGLGLPLTKALVELHGGSLAIESELGKGTRVIVQLPVSQAPEAQNAVPALSGVA